ncbi:MAG: hypothetical protein ACM3JJ_10785, partial [Hyphomicrobiales bacterium]
ADGPVAIYVAVGPYWSKNRYFDETFYDYTGLYPNVYSYYSREEKSWEVGGLIATGFEWFFRSKLSVTGRVGVSAGIGRDTTRHHDWQMNGLTREEHSDRQDEDSATAGSTSATMGVSVYF